MRLIIPSCSLTLFGAFVSSKAQVIQSFQHERAPGLSNKIHYSLGASTRLQHRLFFRILQREDIINEFFVGCAERGFPWLARYHISPIPLRLSPRRTCQPPPLPSRWTAIFLPRTRGDVRVARALRTECKSRPLSLYGVSGF